MFFKLFVYIFVKCFITILSAVLLHFDKLFFLLFIIFFAIGSLEELDQELGLDDNNHGNAAKVKDLVEKLKSQTEKDRRKRQQRTEKKDFVSLRPTPYAGEDSNNSRMSSRRSSSEEREGSAEHTLRRPRRPGSVHPLFNQWINEICHQ